MLVFVFVIGLAYDTLWCNSVLISLYKLVVHKMCKVYNTYFVFPVAVKVSFSLKISVHVELINDKMLVVTA